MQLKDIYSSETERERELAGPWLTVPGTGRSREERKKKELSDEKYIVGVKLLLLLPS